MPQHRPLAGLAAALMIALALPGAAQAKTKKQFYVSLGDSYATGYQPVPGHATTDGFANQLPRLAKAKGYRLQLVNFGCGGATTVSILKSKGCVKAARAVGGPVYSGRTQVAAAERFLRRNRGKVALVSVSIGGNDVTACAKAPDPVACVGDAKARIEKNVSTLAKRLRKAAGKKVRVVGTTYPDVILGQWVAQPPNQDLARLSVFAFQQIINPTLKAAYAKAKGRFVDVTAATGAYTPLDQTTTLDPYGTIPIAVAKVCELTWYCARQDIHSHRAGYKVIAQLIADTLPARKG